MNTIITDFGASPELPDNTAAIQAAIEACAASGGGRVTVPQGRFVTGTVRLRSNVELHLEQGATLRASLDPDSYNTLEEYPENGLSTNEGWDFRHLILAVRVENVALTGLGTIEGAADAWFGEPYKFSSFVWRDGIRNTIDRDKGKLRPGQLIVFVECRGVRMTDLHVTGSTCWCCFFHGCDYVQVRGLDIRNDYQHANTDGIDIDSCKYVTISDCIIKTGDDCIAIRGSAAKLTDPSKVCEYVTVTNCVMWASACGIRIGVGYGAVKHVRVSNCVIEHAGDAVDFNTAFGGRGHCELDDISFSDMSCEGLSRLLWLCTWGVPVTRVTFSNIRASVMADQIIYTDTVGMIRDVTLRNVDFFFRETEDELTEKVRKERGEYMLRCENIEGLRLEDVRIFADEELRKLWSGERSITNCN